MAAKVPETIIRENMGSLTLIVATFAGATTLNSIDTSDTWASGIPSTVAWWAVGTDSPTTNTEGIDMNLTTVATGVFTFYTGSENRNVKAYVLARN